MDVAIPASITALLDESGRLPPSLAECFDPAETMSGNPDWLDVAGVVDEQLALPDLDPEIRGALALLGAYGHVEACFIMVDEVGERSSRALDLLADAAAHGIDDAEIAPITMMAKRLFDTDAEYVEDVDELDALEAKAWGLSLSSEPDSLRRAADLYARIAGHGSTPERTLRAKWYEARARYQAGDRMAALALCREVAYVDVVPTEVVLDVDDAWILLMADATDHDGPDAVRGLWRAARDLHDHFPYPGTAVRLIERLLGKNVPDVVTEAAAIRRKFAEREQGKWPLRRDDRRVLKLAKREIDGAPG